MNEHGINLVSDVNDQNVVAHRLSNHRRIDDLSLGFLRFLHKRNAIDQSPRNIDQYDIEVFICDL